MESNGIQGTVTVGDEKVSRRLYTRRVGLWALCWVRFLHWWAIRKMGLSPNDSIFTGTKPTEIIMAKLLARSKWQDVRWHGRRRLCDATLFQAGALMPNIKSWFR